MQKKGLTSVAALLPGTLVSGLITATASSGLSLQLFGSIKDRVPSGPALTFIFISVRLFVTQHRPDSPTWEFKIRVSRVSNSDLLLLRDLMTLSL